ncbi:hypothetical protein FB645_002103 [Coemansia sp. IMI 203386]|nr:hypothetical protein FB645_002103 [Coemansia sp. IMI 203386]
MVLSRREIIGVLFLLGQLLNELSNLCLKLVIRQDRPNPRFGDGFGMPSSHSQFMGFFAVFVVLYLQCRITTNRVHKILVQLGAVGLSVPVIISRVYLGYHTLPQVCAGAITGIASGLFWFWFLENVVYPSGIVDFVLESGISKWLLLRDSRNIKDIALAEYNIYMLAKSNAKDRSTSNAKQE